MYNYKSINDYIRALASVVMFTVVIFVPQWFPPVVYVKKFMIKLTGWNWTWPLVLIVMGLLLVKGFKRRFAVPSLTNWVFGTVFMAIVSLGLWDFPQFNKLTGAFPTLIYQFTVSYAEEFYFRAVCYGLLRKREAKLYQNDMMSELAPISMLVMAFIFAAMHGVNPILAGTGPFSLSWFQDTFFVGLWTTLLFITTRSIAAPGLYHFLANVNSIIFKA